MRYIRLIILTIILILVSCKNPVEKLLRNAGNPDKTTLAIMDRNGIIIKVQTLPADYYAILEANSYNTFSNSSIDSLFEKYRKNIYLLISFSADKHDVLYAGKGDYKQLTDQMGFNMAENVVLTNDNDTICLLGFHFPRFYGLSNSSEIIFVYSKPTRTSNPYFNLLINEFGLGTGNLNFELKTKRIIQNAVISISSYKKYRTKIKNTVL
jgi:hypothetical protein